MMSCDAAAAALCTAIGGMWGPIVLLAATNILGFVAIYMKAHKSAKSTNAKTDELRAEVAETRRLVSVRPPALTMPADVPSIPPLPIVTGEEGEHE